VDLHPNEQQDRVNIVLVTGFESFNRDLYERAGWLLPREMGVNLQGWFGLLFVVPYSSYKDIQHFVTVILLLPNKQKSICRFRHSNLPHLLFGRTQCRYFHRLAHLRLRR
jgi:hypothetical protein